MYASFAGAKVRVFSESANFSERICIFDVKKDFYTLFPCTDDFFMFPLQ
jgi:hypothetical protein